MIHDVVDTRTGWIRKLKEIPEKDNDKEYGIDKRVRNKLKEACIAIIDPFDFSYCPSSGFELKSFSNSRSMISKMLQFIK